MQNGFFIIPRAIERYEVFNDMDSLGFYTVLMRSLRFRETYIDGVEVGVNQLLISKPELARRCNLTVSKVRRMLKEFQEVGGIRCENIKNKYTLITFLEPFIYKNDSDKGGKGNPPPLSAQAEDNSDICVREEAGSVSDKSNVNTVVSKRGVLKEYGRFKNIYLSEDEYSALKAEFSNADNVLNKLSVYLKNHPEKSTKNHYAQLLGWHYNEKEQNTANNAMGSLNYQKEKTYTPDPTASYDIERAEARAKAGVPKQIKFRDGRVIYIGENIDKQ